MVAFYLPTLAKAQSGAALAFTPSKDAAPFAPNAFIRVGTDSTVTVIAKHIEMGQGPYTGLTTIVAEEIDADWSQMRVEGAPAEAPTTRGFASILAQGIAGLTAREVLDIPADFPQSLGLTRAVSPLRIAGMTGMLMRAKRQVQARLDAR